jgi:hypothetical protein
MAGAVRATMASISAEPESGEVRLLLAGASLLCGMRAQSCAQFCCEIGCAVAGRDPRRSAAGSPAASGAGRGVGTAQSVRRCASRTSLRCRRRRRLALHARKPGGLGTREAVQRMSDRHEPHGGTAVRLVACQPPQRGASRSWWRVRACWACRTHPITPPPTQAHPGRIFGEPVLSPQQRLYEPHHPWLAAFGQLDRERSCVTCGSRRRSGLATIVPVLVHDPAQ